MRGNFAQYDPKPNFFHLSSYCFAQREESLPLMGWLAKQRDGDHWRCFWSGLLATRQTQRGVGITAGDHLEARGGKLAPDLVRKFMLPNHEHGDIGVWKLR